MTRLLRRHTLSCLLATALLPAGAATTVLAQDGAYIVEPWSGRYDAVGIQPGDQRIVASGAMSITYPDTTTDERLAIARYSSFGTPDTTYGIGGPSIPPLSGLSAPALGAFRESGISLVIQPDGKAVVPFGVRGPALYDSSHGVARFTTGGALDSGFGGGGWTSLDVWSNDYGISFNGVGLQSTGKVVVSLPTQTTANVPAILGRLKANGAIDSGSGGFGPWKTGYTQTYLTPSGRSHYFGVAVQSDNKLLAVGYNWSDSGRRLHVARYTTNGTLDRTFNGSGYRILVPAGISETHGFGIALQSNGKIVVVGSCTGIDGYNDMLVARFNTNGTLDTSFAGGSGFVRLDVDGTASATSETGMAIAIQPDGRIVAVGFLGDAVESPRNVLVVRLNANGTPDGTFSLGGLKLGTPPAGPDYHSFYGSAVALQADGHIIVAGRDDWDATNAEAPHPLLIRFEP